MAVTQWAGSKQAPFKDSGFLHQIILNHFKRKL